jgi:Zn-dependent M28 family amino/carboxypeptidase
MPHPLLIVALFLIASTCACAQTTMPEFKRPAGESFKGPLPELTDAQKTLSAHLKAHVTKLASDIGPRSVWDEKGLLATVDYLKKSLADLGYTVNEQAYDAQGKKVLNLEVEIKGAATPDQIFIVGAHYDSVRGQPAANDNGSGVAAVLEMARAFKEAKPGKTVRFVFFVNEEPPFSWTDLMGSVVYAKRCRERKENVVGMISMETIGFYSDEKGSQKYPPPFDKFFPAEGNYAAFVADTKSEQLMQSVIAGFRRSAQFPSEGIATAPEIKGIGYSDHWSFWQQDYRAMMITDTAMFRYPHYHTDNDTPDKLDYDRMARVVEGVTASVKDIIAAK